MTRYGQLYGMKSANAVSQPQLVWAGTGQFWVGKRYGVREDRIVDRQHVAIGRDPSAWPFATKPDQHFARVVVRLIF
jgi:hypothetical protein